MESQHAEATRTGTVAADMVRSEIDWKTRAGIDWGSYSDHSGYYQPHELLEQYCPGGFHPVALGDTFHNGRYVIKHKLGWGGFATVWLARDIELRFELSVQNITLDVTY